MGVASSVFHQILREGFLIITDLKWSRKPVSYLLIELSQYDMNLQQAGKVAKHFKYLTKFGLGVLHIPLIGVLVFIERSMP